MDFEELSIFRNKPELVAFARGYILAMPDDDKCYEEHDEWCAFSDEIDINFYTVLGNVCATAYKVIDGYIDTNQFEDLYHEPTPETVVKSLMKKRAQK